MLELILICLDDVSFVLFYLLPPSEYKQLAEVGLVVVVGDESSGRL